MHNHRSINYFKGKFHGFFSHAYLFVVLCPCQLRKYNSIKMSYVKEIFINPFEFLKQNKNNLSTDCFFFKKKRKKRCM